MVAQVGLKSSSLDLDLKRQTQRLGLAEGMGEGSLKTETMRGEQRAVNRILSRRRIKLEKSDFCIC